MEQGIVGRSQFRALGQGRRLALAVFATLLAACQQSVMVRPAAVDPVEPEMSAAPDAERFHEVQSGDTLYKISVQYGVDYRDLAAWNGIDAPYTIYPRQRLRVSGSSNAPVPDSPPATVAAAPSRPAPTPSSSTSRVERLGDNLATPRDSGYDERYGVTVPEGAEPLDGSKPAAASTGPIASAPTPVTAAPTTAPAVATPSASAEAAAPVAAATGAAVATAGGVATAPAIAPSAASAPASASAAPVPAPTSAATSSAAVRPSAAGWIWPAQGRVVVTYAAGDPTRQGVDISGELGSPVVAARDGEVVYSGAGLIGYGELIIIKHTPELLSAYGHNRVRLVKEGDKVKAGQKIAEMGKNAANRVLVHFEIRRNGKPVDPAPLLPAR
jgi:lipoprotein NlpD